MKALRQYGGKDMRLEDIPEPEPGPGEVKIKVKWCGICGSDVHEYRGGAGLLPLKKPHPGTGKLAPITGGHEFSGQVVKIGENVEGVKIGERVTVRPTIPCNRCYYCQRGKHIQCVILATIGGAADGAFADFVVVPSSNVYRLPDEVTYESAAFTEPLACAVHGVKRSHIEPGENVAIIGAGPIGLLTMQVARACGANQIFVFDFLANRRALAKELGATEVIDPSKQDPGKAIAAMTDGRRADTVFECAGPCEAMLLAETVSGRGSKIVEMGVMTTPCNFPFQNLFMREKTIITSQGYVDEFPAAISFLASERVRCDPILISSKIALGDVIDKGIKALIGERRAEHCKILVSPDL
jgi:(R,R)-butanediol dehydrogenase / meso-butanediol dehydrogenase / diacetyl reductase